MKTFVTLALLLFLSLAGAAEQRSPCWDKAKGQLDMDRCAGQDRTAAEQQMDDAYQKLLQKFAAEPARLRAIRRSQQAWLRFRDAQLQALYPQPRINGSSTPMCMGIKLAELAQQRTKQLEDMLNPIEGDVCGMHGAK